MGTRARGRGQSNPGGGSEGAAEAPFDERVTYAEAVARLTALRGGEHAGMRPGLERIEALLAALGHPERRYRLVQIGGTNGKGSVAALLAAILKAAGHRVGLYTSPHLVSFRERIRVNAEAIPEDGVVDGVEALGTLVARLDATMFEATTAPAPDHFAREAVDVAVLAGGRTGGRLRRAGDARGSRARALAGALPGPPASRRRPRAGRRAQPGRRPRARELPARVLRRTPGHVRARDPARQGRRRHRCRALAPRGPARPDRRLEPARHPSRHAQGGGAGFRGARRDGAVASRGPSAGGRRPLDPHRLCRGLAVVDRGRPPPPRRGRYPLPHRKGG